MKQTIVKTTSYKSVRLVAGFFVFIVVLSAARNLFFPVVEPFGFAGIPKFKIVFGAPAFFVPFDFAGCIIIGTRVYPVALAINIATYLVVVAIVSRLRILWKMRALRNISRHAD